ncbi:hypothetical protein HU761_26095 [Pseudomonas sp. SWRI59]|uniref:hypothetical protein n=1 Tax=Pseudomonas TaxID=286 RepID=UPI0016442E38|nr:MULTISPECIES: hypothetical protein [unclassified Pseudomonas]MBC3504855.1 hypothetical protein [Pseudomonas sp. SWRI59]MBC3510103.1 hypothetical protein [Pseudomonas sp. SWRI68]
MLNDYGKSLLKPWLSVQNFVWAFALIFMVSLLIRVNDLTSSEIASWVQAVGSILAIIGALAVSRAQVSSQNAVAFEQIQHQIDMKKRSDRDRAEAFLAVVDCAATLCNAVCQTTIQDGSVTTLMRGWTSHMREVSQSSLLALRNLPVHEFGSYELVVAHGTVLAAFVEFIAEVDIVSKGGRSVKVPVSHGAFGGMAMQNALMQAGFGTFKDAHIAKHGPLSE